MSDTRETYDWGTLTWHRQSNTLAGTMHISAGQTCGKHIHDNANEVIIVTHGQVTLQVGEARLSLKSGQSHRVAANTPHELATEPHIAATVTIIFDNPDRNYQLL